MDFIAKDLKLTVKFCKEMDVAVLGNQYILINLENSSITLHNREKSCVFCHIICDLVYYKNHAVCTHCLEKLKDAKPGNYFY